MERLTDNLLTVVYAVLIAMGGRYTLRQVMHWSQHMAFDKVAQGLGKLEPDTRKMTGGKLDF